LGPHHALGPELRPRSRLPGARRRPPPDLGPRRRLPDGQRRGAHPVPAVAGRVSPLTAGCVEVPFLRQLGTEAAASLSIGSVSQLGRRIPGTGVGSEYPPATISSIRCRIIASRAAGVSPAGSGGP